RPDGPRGPALNRLKLALGDESEVDSNGANTSAAKAQLIRLPVTVNGRIASSKTEDYYRFHAAKGQHLLVEVNAGRLGSQLDTFVEVLDAQARPIERAVARPVLQTFTTLSERDSSGSGLRLLSWTGMDVGDYVLAGGELIRIAVLPKGPDEDTR